MHEMGITAGILETAVREAEKQNATRINEVRVSIGQLTEIVEDALQFAFEALRTDTMAADAVLVVTKVPARSRCMQCGNEFGHDQYDLTCPKCESFMCEALQGRELRIDSIDID